MDRDEYPVSPAREVRLDDAGENRSAWVTLLTTEHYNLQTARASTIGEANGRASIFLGAVSAGLISLGFAGGGGATSTTFQVVVLTGLTFLGVVTFLRCLEISIDDWQFSLRISGLRAAYRRLVPEIADLLEHAAGVEQATAMLTRKRQPFQIMLSVAGTIGVVTSMVFGADCGALVYGLHAPLGVAIAVGAVVGGLALAATVWFQNARWRGAAPDRDAFRLG